MILFDHHFLFVEDVNALCSRTIGAHTDASQRVVDAIGQGTGVVEVENAWYVGRTLQLVGLVNDAVVGGSSDEFVIPFHREHQLLVGVATCATP